MNNLNLNPLFRFCLLLLLSVAVFLSSRASGFEDYALSSPPDSISKLVDATRKMYEAGVPRQQIADWLVKMVDDRILNTNDPAELIFEPRSLLGIRGFVYGKASIAANRTIESNKNQDNYYTIAYRAWKTGLGQCQENANIIYYVLKSAGVKENIRIHTAGEGHMYTVWGIRKGADPNNPDTWGNDALVVDSWYGGVLKSNEVTSNKWFKNNKEDIIISDQTTFHDIDAPNWIVENKKSPVSKSDTDCFIATAVYGTPYAADIEVLRHWRDQFLRRRYLGRKFIHFYERVGPVLAGWLNQHQQYKPFVRKYIVMPAVQHARNKLNER
jgi:hypothetical protein